MKYFQILTSIVNPEFLNFEIPYAESKLTGYKVDDIAGQKTLVKKFKKPNEQEIFEIFQELRDNMSHYFLKLDNESEEADTRMVMRIITDMFIEFIRKIERYCNDKELKTYEMKCVKVLENISTKLGIGGEKYIRELKRETRKILRERRELRKAVKKARKMMQEEKGLLERLVEFIKHLIGKK